jgi:hypothetical protein
MADVLVSGDQDDPRADGIRQPLDRLRRGCRKAPDQIRTIGRSARAHEIRREPLDRIGNARLALKARARGRHRAGRE